MANIIEDRYVFDFDSQNAIREVAQLAEALRESQRAGENLSEASKEIIKANGGIAEASKRLQSILEQETKTTDGLRAKISALQKIRGQLVIGSREYERVTRSIANAQRELSESTNDTVAASKKLQDALNSEVKTTTALNEKLQALQTLRSRATIGSQEFADLTRRIANTTKELSEANTDVVADTQKRIEAQRALIAAANQEANTTDELSEKLQALQTIRGRTNIESAEYERLTREIASTTRQLIDATTDAVGIRERLLSIIQREATTTAGLSEQLQALQAIRQRTNIDSAEYETLTRQIADVTERLSEAQRDQTAEAQRAAEANRLLVQTANQESRTTAELSQQLQALQTIRSQTNIDAAEYEQLTRQIATVTERLTEAQRDQTAEASQAVQAQRDLLSAANSEAATLDELSAKLQALQTIRARTNVQSREYIQISSQIAQVNERLAEANSDAFANEGLRNAAFRESQSIDELNEQLSALRTLRNRVNTESAEYEQLTRQIATVTNQLTDATRDNVAEQKQIADALVLEGRTLDELNTKLATLRRLRSQTNIESSEYVRLGNEITEVNNRIANATNDAGEQTLSFTQRITGSISQFQGAIGLTAGLTAAGVGVTQLSNLVRDLDSQINAVRTSTAGLSSESAENLTGDLIGSSQTFNVDTDEQLNAIKTAANEFNIDAAQVFEDLQIGLVRSTTDRARGEVLDSLREYSTFFNQAGLDLAQSIGVLNLGDQLGIFNDKAADAIKETNIRLSEQVSGTVEAVTNAFGENFSTKLFDDINSGALSTFDALQLISTQAQTIDLNPEQYQTLIANIGGGALEDAGRNFFNALKDIESGSDDARESLNAYQRQQLELLDVNRQIGRAQTEAAAQLSATSREYDTIRARIRLFLTEGAIRVLTFFQALPQAVRENRAAFAAFGAAIASLRLRAAVGAFQSLVAALRAVTAAQIRSNLAALANPYVAVTAALTALTAALFVYNRESDSTARRNKILNDGVKKISKEFANEKRELNSLFDALSKTNEGTEERRKAIAAINNQYSDYLPNLLTEKSTAEEIAQTYQLLNRAILENIGNRFQQKIAQELLDEAFEKSAELLRVQRKDLSLTEKAYDSFAGTVNSVARRAGVPAFLGNVLSNTETGLQSDLRSINRVFAELPETVQQQISIVEKIFQDNDLSKILSGIEKSSKNVGKAISNVGGDPDTKTKIEAAADSIAGLRKTVNELRKSINDTSLGDETLITELDAQLDAAIVKLDQAEAKLEELRNPRGATGEVAPVETLDLIPDNLESETPEVEVDLKPNVKKFTDETIKEIDEQIDAVEIEIKADEQKIKDIIALASAVTDDIFSVANSFAEATNAQLDGVVDRQRGVLDDMLANSEDFNSRQIEIEKNRLNLLEQEQRKAAERAAEIAAIELAAKSALAVANAATLPFPGNIIAISSTIAALVTGIREIRSSVANLYDGTDFVERGSNPRGRDTIPAMLNEGESVISTDTTKAYTPAIKAIRRHAIPAAALNEFVSNWRGGAQIAAPVSIPDISRRRETQSLTVGATADMKTSENYLKSIDKTLRREKPRKALFRHPKKIR